MATVTQTLDQAIAHHQAGRFDEADQIYEEILRIDPDQPDAIHLSGLIAHQRNDHDLAIDRIERAIELAPNNPVSHNNLASAYLGLHRSHEAAKSCHLALKMRPDYPMAHANLGKALAAQGKHEEAVPCYQRAIQDLPNCHEVRHHLGESLAALDRVDEAIAAYEEAIRINPQYPEASNELGNLFLGQRRFEEATACYQRATALRPNSVAAYVNWGKCLADQEQFDEAIAKYEHALTIAPNNFAAWVNLAAAMNQLERWEETVAASRRALEIRPDSYEPLVNMQCALRDLDQIDEAEQCCLKALEIKPDCASSAHNLGTIYVIQGKHDQATQLFRDSLAMDPDHYQSRISLAAVRRLTVNDTDFIEQCERLLTGEDLPRKSRIQLHFALGKGYDDCGRWDEAFAHYELGNRLEDVTFDLEDFAVGVDRLIEIFTAEFLTHPPARGRHTDMPVYIAGMPRSGTTLVEQVLSCHDQFAAGGEIGLMQTIRAAMPGFLDDMISCPRGVPDLDGETMLTLADALVARLREVDGAATRISDKMPANFLHLGLVAMALPRARIIHCRRHPLDTCLSCYFQSFAQRMGFAYDQTLLGRYYREYERIMAHWRDVLRPGTFFEVDYENLVENQEEVSRELVEFCGLDWDDACLDFHKNDRAVRTASNWQVRQPMYNRSVGRWKHYEKHLGPLKQALAWNERGQTTKPVVQKPVVQKPVVQKPVVPAPLLDSSFSSVDAFAVWESPASPEDA